jgi:D-lactate dehydrogenase
MNDQERLNRFLSRLKQLQGLDEEKYARLKAELDRASEREGYDAQGRFRVAFYDARPYDIESFERCNAERYAIHYISAPLDRETARAARGCKAVCVFVNDMVEADIARSLAEQGVELIALRCAGFNNVDLEACAAHGISVVRVPAYSPHAVAEHTVGLMLTLNRRFNHAYVRNRAGSFLLDGLTGFDMYGKTAGIVGTGKIGRCVIEILIGFGCRVLAYDTVRDEEVAARPQVEYVEMDRLLSESDIVTLHVPLFPDTHHIIDRVAFDKMKDGVMFINTSRGGLVDTRALIDALKSEKIGSAGLDVYEEEAGIFFRDLSDRVLTDDVLARLLTFNNVMVTSHQGFLTREALQQIAQTTLENVAEFESGRRAEQLTHCVRPQ